MVALALDTPRPTKRRDPNAVDWLQLALTAFGQFIAIGGVLIAVITGAVPLHPFRRRRERYQAAVQQRLADERQQLVADKLDEISSLHAELLVHLSHTSRVGTKHGRDEPAPARRQSRPEGYDCPPFYAKDLTSLSFDEVIRIEHLITTLQETIMDRFHYACRFDKSIGTPMPSLMAHCMKVYAKVIKRPPKTPPLTKIRVLDAFSSASSPASSAEEQQRNKQFLLHFRVTRVGLLHGDWFHFVDVVRPYAFVVLPPGWILRALGYKDVIGYPAVKRYYYYNLVNGTYSDTRPEGGWLFDLNALDSDSRVASGVNSRVSRRETPHGSHVAYEQPISAKA